MKQLYFIRHGLSEANKQQVFSGHTDTPLAKEGHQQAKLAGIQASQQGLAFDLIISSPMQRARHTAKHIASQINYPANKIILSDLLKERNYGSLEGLEADSELAQKYSIDESHLDNHPQVETLQKLQARAHLALSYLESLDHETVLVVSHGSFGRALYRSINGLPLTVRDIRYNNAEIVKFI